MIPFNKLGFVFKHFGYLIYPKKVVKELCVFLKPLESEAKVLDVGAGTGMLSEFAYKCRNDLKYEAVDPAQGMLQYAPSYLKTHRASAEHLPFEDASFEVVIMGEALHHFTNPNLAIQEVKRVLKKDGKLFIYDFDVSTFRGNAIYKVEKLLGEPANFYEPDGLKKMLEEYGFVVEVKHFSWRYTISAIL